MKILIFIGIILAILGLSILIYLSIILSDDGYAELIKKPIDDERSDNNE